VTAAPARDNRSAQALPIPLAAPVTKAVRPVISKPTVEGPGATEDSPMILPFEKPFVPTRVSVYPTW